MSTGTRALIARSGKSGWRLIVIGAIALSLIGAAATDVAVGRPTAPPQPTFEVIIDSGPVAAPGGTISFHGTCWAVGPTQEVRVRAVRYAPDGSGIAPFDFSITVAVHSSNGSFSGTIAVPGDALNGPYDLRAICFTQDQYFGTGLQPFTIDGPQITTTTTSVPLRAVPTSPPAPAPAPARPLAGTATLTG